MSSSERAPLSSAGSTLLPEQSIDDPTFRALARLWSVTHPQARRALMFYAAMLHRGDGEGDLDGTVGEHLGDDSDTRADQ